MFDHLVNRLMTAFFLFQRDSQNVCGITSARWFQQTWTHIPLSVCHCVCVCGWVCFHRGILDFFLLPPEKKVDWVQSSNHSVSLGIWANQRSRWSCRREECESTTEEENKQESISCGQLRRANHSPAASIKSALSSVSLIYCHPVMSLQASWRVVLAC